MNLLLHNQWSKWYIKDEVEFDPCTEGRGNVPQSLDARRWQFRLCQGILLKSWRRRMVCGSARGPATLTLQAPATLALSQQPQQHAAGLPARPAWCIVHCAESLFKLQPWLFRCFVTFPQQRGSTAVGPTIWCRCLFCTKMEFAEQRLWSYCVIPHPPAETRTHAGTFICLKIKISRDERVHAHKQSGCKHMFDRLFEACDHSGDK